MITYLTIQYYLNNITEITTALLLFTLTMATIFIGGYLGELLTNGFADLLTGPRPDWMKKDIQS